LNRLIPRVFTSPNCVFCNELDIIEHFFCKCPYKQPVWRTTANRFLLQPANLEINHILSLSTPSLSTRLEFMLDLEDIIANTLLHIWSVP
ncbi:hypothetical protein BDA99DRAFT_431618, partial [Phascolomyces articulosus]